MAPAAAESPEGEEIFARASWAILILSCLSKKRSHTMLPPEGADEDEECDGEDCEDHSVADAHTERNVALQDAEDWVRSKFLDCLAQLLSPSKGWDGVCATALREYEDYVEVQLARNDGFGSPCPAEGEAQVRATEGFEESYGRKLTEYLSSPHASSTKFENLAIEYAGERVDGWGKEFQNHVTKLNARNIENEREYNSLFSSESWGSLMEHLRSEDRSSSPLRTEIARRAYECAASTEIRQLLDIIFKPALSLKLQHALRCMARPILDCRMLRCIAERYPAFRIVHFSVLRPWPKTGIRSEYHHVDIVQAWTQLSGRKPSAQEEKVLCSFAEQFRSGLRETYSLHAEIQLCMYHEANPHLSPTHSYFGCSRKACLSCETFLCSLSDPIATRGRQGVLYPAWGIPKATSAECQRALVLLEKELTIRIGRFLDTSIRGGKPDFQQAVPQSGIVSDFPKLALEEQKEKERVLKAAQKEEKARVDRHLRLQGAAMTKGTIKGTLESHDVCVICHGKPGKRCARCKNTWYCSELCQESDWPSHKLLCKRFATQPARPSSSHKRAIFFPVDQQRPRISWMRIEHRCDEGTPSEHPDLDHYLGKDAVSGSIFIEHNPVRGRNLGVLACSGIIPGGEGYVIVLYYRDVFLRDGSAENRSIRTSTAPFGIPPVSWRGPIVAMRMTPQQSYENITMEDFRHIIDYLSLYGSEEPRESIDQVEGRTSATIRGVKICCNGEKELHGSETFVSVEVSRANATRLRHGVGVDVSPLSQMLGMPLKLWKYPVDEWVLRDRPGMEGQNTYSNRHAAFLMLGTNPNKGNWGWAPRHWSMELGNVLAVRADEKDLVVDDMKAMCHFATYKLQPMFEEALGGGLIQRTKEEVLDFITWENMLAFRDEVGDEMDDEG